MATTSTMTPLEVFWDLVYIWRHLQSARTLRCFTMTASTTDVCSFRHSVASLQSAAWLTCKGSCRRRSEQVLALLHIRARPQHAAQVARIKGAAAVQAGSKRSAAAAPAPIAATPQGEVVPASSSGKRPRGAPALDLLAEERTACVMVQSVALT